MAKEVSQTVVNALRLLECFGQEEELGITELAADIGVGKAVAARLVSSLGEFGYLRQNPQTRKYRLGLKLVYWGSLAQERNEIVQLVEPYLWTLSQEFQVSAHMAVLDHFAALITCKVTRGPIVYMNSRVGTSLPIHACATGKCLLAYSSEQFLQEFLGTQPLVRFTEQTITDPDVFLEEAQRIRQQGYALDNEESNLGLSCMAVPLLNAGGQITAAISLSGQTKFMKKNHVAILRRLREVQHELSSYL